MRVWELEPGQLMVAGGFSDLALHHHPAVQITVGGRGVLSVTGDGDEPRRCRLVVIASGVRHAVRSDSDAEALTLYLGLQTPQGNALNSLARNHNRPRGVWIVDDGPHLAEATAAALAENGPDRAAGFLVDRLRGTSGGARSVHPQLRRAIEVVTNRVPEHIDVASLAGAVALSPDYLGRLCKQQTGVSLSATIRWERLVAAVSHLLDGRSITDAAHLAGFADGSHANRVCQEMTGATPSELAAAVHSP